MTAAAPEKARVLTYRGRPLTELTKEELIKAIEHAVHEIEYLRSRPR